ncbi:MAG: WG repeat-containing protein, partial [Chitinophagaceae bacterium]
TYIDQQGRERFAPVAVVMATQKGHLAALSAEGDDERHRVLDLRSGRYLDTTRWIDVDLHSLPGFALVTRFDGPTDQYDGNGQLGVMDGSGRMITPPKYSSVHPANNGYLLVELKGKYGVLDPEGREALPPVYDEVDIPTWDGTPYFRPLNDGKYGLFDRQGTLLVPVQYASVELESGHPYIIVSDGRDGNGFYDRTGRAVVPFAQQGLQIPYGTDGRFIEASYGDYTGIYHSSGRLLVPKEYNEFSYYLADGWIVGRRLDSAYLFDTAGRRLGGAYNELAPGSNGLVAASLGEKAGYLDRSGATAIPFVYDIAKPFSEGLAAVRQGSRWGYIDPKGKLAIALSDWNDAGAFRDGLAPVERDSLTGFINRSGKLLTPFAFAAAREFSDGVALVRTGARWGLIDRKGRQLAAPQYDNVDDFSDGLAAVQRAGKWGYIDRKGREAIAPQFDSYHDFKNGTALVKKNGEWIRIDKKGREVEKNN